jgi:hypothetical protein
MFLGFYVSKFLGFYVFRFLCFTFLVVSKFAKVIFFHLLQKLYIGRHIIANSDYSLKLSLLKNAFDTLHFKIQKK